MTFSDSLSGICHFEALCKALAKQACDDKMKKNMRGKSNVRINVVAAANSQEDEPLGAD